MIGETPQISSSTYPATTTALGNIAFNQANSVQFHPPAQAFGMHNESRIRQILEEQSMAEVKSPRRYVQVIIADVNENIPLDQCLLYKGEPKLTDATDQELYFEIDVKNLLDKHNEKRIKYHDKKVKERTEFLEPAKIRDLKMVVVNIAQF
jgi:hypothetical protein